MYKVHDTFLSHIYFLQYGYLDNDYITWAVYRAYAMRYILTLLLYTVSHWDFTSSEAQHIVACHAHPALHVVKIGLVLARLFHFNSLLGLTDRVSSWPGAMAGT